MTTIKYQGLKNLMIRIQNNLDFMIDDYDLINEDDIYKSLLNAREKVFNRMVQEI